MKAAFEVEEIPPEMARAPLTWGQRAMWTAICNRGPNSAKLISIKRIVPLPRRAPGDVASVLSALGHLIQRHSSLRTLVHFGAGYQEVLSSGAQPVRLATAVDDDGTATAQRLADELASTLFEHDTELPQRVGLVLAGDRVSHLAIVFSHATADFRSVELLLRELRQLLLGKEIHEPAGPQSADIGRREETAGHRRRSDRAARHWVAGFQRLPADTLPAAGPEQHPRWRRCVLVSAAADVATRLIARKHSATSTTVLATAVAATIARWSGNDVCGIYMMADNRAVDDYATAVAKLNQLGLVVADFTRRPSFSEALPAVWHAAFEAYRHSYYDPAQLAEAYQEAGLVYLIGVSPHCYLNDIRLSPADTDLFGRDTDEAAVRASMRESVFSIADEIDGFTWRMRIEVTDARAGIGLALTGDTAFLPPPVARRFLRDVEALLVEAAFHDVAWPWDIKSEAWQ